LASAIWSLEANQEGVETVIEPYGG
jgi:hypothetical protein